VSTYDYDARGRLAHLLTTANHNGRAWKVQDTAYTFKVDNSISELVNTPDTAADGACDSTIRYTYQYDGLNRLVHAKGSFEKNRTGGADEPAVRKFERGYAYADNGNLTSKIIYNPDSGATNERWIYSYANHAATRVESAGATRFAMRYDAAGNMTEQYDAAKKLTKNMIYSSENRIKEVYDANAKLMGQYDYDDQGFRVRKLSRQTVQGIEQYVETVSPSMFVTLQKHRTIDGRDTGGESMMNHVYLNGVRIAAVAPSGSASYYHNDKVDSVTVVTSHEYLPFGEDWITEGDTKNAPKYNSQELDKETNFYFYNARYYDPQIARFVTADNIIPYEDSTQSWNRFSYTRNNPIIYKDPTGHAEECPSGTKPVWGPASRYHELKTGESSMITGCRPDSANAGNSGDNKSNSGKKATEKTIKENLQKPKGNDKGKGNTLKLASPLNGLTKDNLDSNITSGYGTRWGNPHNAIDLKGDRGDEIKAAESGEIEYKVQYKKDDKGNIVRDKKGIAQLDGYGYYADIKHSDGSVTRYAHMNKKDWQTYREKYTQRNEDSEIQNHVDKGDVVGGVGNSGRSVGPGGGYHLHFEVRVNGRAENPVNYLFK
jgi:RHS repeat-associated protein